jgi:hypothetical protein
LRARRRLLRRAARPAAALAGRRRGGQQGRGRRRRRRGGGDAGGPWRRFCRAARCSHRRAVPVQPRLRVQLLHQWPRLPHASHLRHGPPHGARIRGPLPPPPLSPRRSRSWSSASVPRWDLPWSSWPFPRKRCVHFSPLYFAFAPMFLLPVVSSVRGDRSW